eukprot:jgi/Mesvir1/12861/Mv05889-RA.1
MASPAYLAYVGVTQLAAPLVALHFGARWLRGKEDPLKWKERWGLPTVPRRPEGPLLWVHAASVGEGASVLPVIYRLLERAPSICILVTTGTVAAAGMLARWLPAGVLCQFVPVDTPLAVRRFLSFWRPSAGVFVESELWPNLIHAARRHGIPLALLNARMSPASTRRWASPLLRPLAHALLTAFTLIMPQNRAEADRLASLGAGEASLQVVGNIKYAAALASAGREERASWAQRTCGVSDPNLGMPGGSSHTSAAGVGSNSTIPGEDAGCIRAGGGAGSDVVALEGDLSGLVGLLRRRPCWLAISTHEGEEDAAAHAHMAMEGKHSGLVTVVAPRQVERVPGIASRLRGMGVRVHVQSESGAPPLDTQVYLVDHVGGAPFLFRLCPIVFVGGSLIPGGGGHNMAEPAAAGCAVLTGLHVGHFQPMVDELCAEDTLAVIQVAGIPALASAVHDLLADPSKAHACGLAAQHAVAQAAGGVLDAVVSRLLGLLPVPVTASVEGDGLWRPSR